MPSAGKPWWQQATALVSLGTGGAMTGFSFVPRPAADLTSPSSVPVHLMALEQAAQPTAADDGALRSAIVNVANYYLPDGGEQDAGRDGGDHLAARQRRRRRPRPILRGVRQPHPGAGRSGDRPAELGHRRHLVPVAAARLGRCPGEPEPGLAGHHVDRPGRAGTRSLACRWATATGRCPATGCVFDGHVEVVTKDANGVLHTIGGDSLPNFSVNAHEYPGPLAAQGVAGLRQQRCAARRGGQGGGGQHRGTSRPPGEEAGRQQPARAGRQRCRVGAYRPAGRRRPSRGEWEAGRRDRHPRAADDGSPAVLPPQSTGGARLPAAHPIAGCQAGA